MNEEDNDINQWTTTIPVIKRQKRLLVFLKEQSATQIYSEGFNSRFYIILMGRVNRKEKFFTNKHGLGRALIKSSKGAALNQGDKGSYVSLL